MANFTKFFSVMALAAMAAPAASAENPMITPTPLEGTINMDIYRYGLNSVELTPYGYVNRASDGFVTLYRNGEVVRQIPASNVPMFYCIDGFEKSQYGAIHVDFWTSNIGAYGAIPGEYTVTFDAGVILFSEAMTPNDEFSLFYTVPGAEMKVSPAAGSTVEELSSITFTVPENATNISAGKAIVLEDIRSDDHRTYAPEVSIDGNVVTLTFNPAITNNSEYLLDLPAGSISYQLDGKRQSSLADSYKYTIAASADASAVSPAPGEYSEFVGMEVDGQPSASIFVLNLAEGETLNFVSMGGIYLYPLNDDGTPDTSVKTYRFKAVADPADNTRVLFNSVSGQTVVKPVAGSYVLSVDGFAFSTSNGFNSAMNFGPYVVLEDTEANYSVEPAANAPVTEISSVTVTFPEASELSWTERQYASLSNGITEYALTPIINGNTLVFSINPVIKEEGEWILLIPQTALSVDGQQTNIKVVYSVADTNSIAGISADADAFDIYTISGISVARKASAETLKALNPGLYIINGKKVIIK